MGGVMSDEHLVTGGGGWIETAIKIQLIAEPYPTVLLNVKRPENPFFNFSGKYRPCGRLSWYLGY